MRKVTKLDKAVVFGAGGAARAVCGALLQRGVTVGVLHRESDAVRARDLRNTLRKIGTNLTVDTLTKETAIRSLIESKIVVNCTPLEIHPHLDASINEADICEVAAGHCAFVEKCFSDAVLNPYETHFLSIAKRFGANSCEGIYMMVHQGREALRLWTGRVLTSSIVAEVDSHLLETVCR